MNDQARTAVLNWKQAVDAAADTSAPAGAPTQHPVVRRKLTPEETAIARSVFGDALDTSQIELTDTGVPLAGDNAVAFPNLVRFPPGTLSQPGATFNGWLVHELTHLWQYQRGHTVPQLAVDAAGGDYDYGGPGGLVAAHEAGKRFGQFTFEEQGNILRHYWERTQRGEDVSAYKPYVDSVRYGTSDGVYPEPAPPPGQPV